LLNARGIRFVVRCDNDSGWGATKAFLHSGADEASLTLKAPNAQDVRDCGRLVEMPRVRLVRQTSPNGKVRVLATNLDSQTYLCHVFAALYHQRWRIEEAFKRLKLRTKLEAVSGLSQQALIVDVAAKVLADNINSPMCLAAADQSSLATRSRKCNSSYAVVFMQRVLPCLVLFIGDVCGSVADAIGMLGTNAGPGMAVCSRAHDAIDCWRAGRRRAIRARKIAIDKSGPHRRVRLYFRVIRGKHGHQGIARRFAPVFPTMNRVRESHAM